MIFGLPTVFVACTIMPGWSIVHETLFPGPKVVITLADRWGLTPGLVFQFYRSLEVQTLP